MAKYFSISGYWKNDFEEFCGYVVKSTHDVDEDEDDKIFFYGLDEKDLIAAVENGKNTANDFVITDYYEIDNP